MMTQYALEDNGATLILLSQVQKILVIRPSSQVAEIEGPTQGACLLFLSEEQWPDTARTCYEKVLTLPPLAIFELTTTY